MVQLLSTEGVVRIPLDGFHRVGDRYGGRVLNALRQNVAAGKKELAQSVTSLIEEHKRTWIDEAIRACDRLVHPTRGAHQLMVFIELEDRLGQLHMVRAEPPRVNDNNIADEVIDP